jgi:hypothetical protein
MQFINENFENYSTKSDYANWIIPGKIQCGPYPYCDGINFDEKSGLQNITNILDDGIDTFVCLCGELPDTTKSYDDSRGIKHPYFPNYKHYTNIVKKLKPNCSFMYIPIADGNIPDLRSFLSHIKLLVELFHKNNIIYIHCAGGHGRTNIYTSTLLYQIYGYHLEPEKCLDIVFYLREKRRKKDKKLEIYNIPKENDRKYIFKPIQEKFVVRVCHFLQIYSILVPEPSGLGFFNSNKDKRIL